jgi:hypothetical protein
MIIHATLSFSVAFEKRTGAQRCLLEGSPVWKYSPFYLRCLLMLNTQTIENLSSKLSSADSRAIAAEADAAAAAAAAAAATSAAASHEKSEVAAVQQLTVLQKQLQSAEFECAALKQQLEIVTGGCCYSRFNLPVILLQKAASSTGKM